MSAERDPLGKFLKPLYDLAAWLRAARVPGAVIGGVAVAILGRPRLTRDLDALVFLEEAKWAEFLKKGRRHGFVVRFADSLQFARECRILLIRHLPSGLDVDMTLGSSQYDQEAIERSVEVRVGRKKIRVVSADDLVVMKAVAHRPRDLADIEGLLDAGVSLNLKHVRHWVNEFAEILEMPELRRDLEGLLRRLRKPKSGR